MLFDQTCDQVKKKSENLFHINKRQFGIFCTEFYWILLVSGNFFVLIVISFHIALIFVSVSLVTNTMNYQHHQCAFSIAYLLFSRTIYLRWITDLSQLSPVSIIDEVWKIDLPVYRSTFHVNACIYGDGEDVLYLKWCTHFLSKILLGNNPIRIQCPELFSGNCYFIFLSEIIWGRQLDRVASSASPTCINFLLDLNYKQKQNKE